MKAIVAVTQDGVIGNNGSIPWRIPEDLHFFRLMTLGSDVIMGKNTYISLPKKPLPKRRNIILSSTMPPSNDGSFIVTRTPKAAASDYPAAFVIGGTETYNAMWQYIDTFIVSHIPGNYPGDTIFPLGKLHKEFEYAGTYTFGTIHLNVSVLTRR